MDPITIKVTWDDLLDAGRPRTSGSRKYRVFVAYQFSSATGSSLRSAIQEAAEKRSDILVLDGHVDEGISWAPEVRDRISKSKVVLADLTGPSKEVVFELGLAADRRVVPVCYEATGIKGLPSWVTADQISTYSGSGLVTLIDRLFAIARESQRGVRKRQPPEPGGIVWLQGETSGWADVFWDAANSLVGEFGMRRILRVSPDTLYSPEDLTEYLSKWLVIACIDGTPADLASHFFIGDTVGRPKAGSGDGPGEWIKRHAIVVSPDRAAREAHLADSARRLSRTDLSRASTVSEFTRLFERHLRRHATWAELG